MSEEQFVKKALKIANDQISNIGTSLVVKKGTALIYQIILNGNLEVKINFRDPKRGQSAFQTDLCVFEANSEGIMIPRVVI